VTVKMPLLRSFFRSLSVIDRAALDVKTSAMSDEVRKHLKKITTLLSVAPWS
jgi:hypothetical protein